MRHLTLLLALWAIGFSAHAQQARGLLLTSYGPEAPRSDGDPDSLIRRVRTLHVYLP